MNNNQQGVLNLIGGLFRHRTLLLWLFFGTLLLTLAITLIMKKQYASEMKVVAQNTRDIEAVSSAKENTTQPQSSASSDTDTRVNSEIELLSDTDLMENLVLFRSKLLPDEAPAPAPGSKEMARAVGRMVNRLDFEPVKKSAVFTITYTDVTPEAAQQVLRELERTYLDKHVQLSRPAGTFSFFKEESNSYVQRMKAAEQQLADFQSTNKYVDLDKEKTELDEGLHALDVTALAEQAQLQSVTGQITSVTSRLRSIEGRITTAIVTTPNPQGIQNLIASITDLKTRRVHLAENFKADDRLIVELDAQIKTSEDALKEMRENDATQTTDNNPAVLSLRQQLETLLVQRAGLVESLRAYHAQEDDYRKRLTQLQQITPENNQLEREVSELRDMNQSISTKRDAARLEDLLDAGQFGNIAVAQQPTFSRQHVKPRMIINMALGGVTGIFLCASALLLLETTRSTILTPKELESLSGVPVLATVPDAAGLDGLLSAWGPESRTGLAPAQTGNVPI
ncbi:GumC family protein [Granulicella sibirica]|uniref:Tyrosine-protein kinase Wzc n=1 Tax=Granulicella sibirica TaxID=2479048 RepID=A0A4Q0T432_9BACT|nr:hypothetical protein [Granulicella sibirica]RXH58403.1 Tyrosine-protein kinase Wzc [Granulicella sibirica]